MSIVYLLEGHHCIQRCATYFGGGCVDDTRSINCFGPSQENPLNFELTDFVIWDEG